MGEAIRVAPRDAFIAQETSKEHRAEGFGLNRTLDTLGGLMGVGFVALILLFYKNQTVFSPSLFKTMVFGVSTFGFLGVLIVIFGVKEKVIAQEVKKEKSKPAGSLKDLPPLFYFYLSCFTLFNLSGSSDAFLILKLKASGFSLLSILCLIIAYNLLATLIIYPVARLSDKRNDRKTPLIIGWVIYTFTYFIFGSTSQTFILGFAFVAYGFYYGFVESMEKTIVADLVPKTHLGRAYGLFNFVGGLIVLPANLLFGWMAETWKMGYAFLLSAMISLLATGFLVFLTTKTKFSLENRV